ncbi:MAG: hypothetical protein OEL76_05390 [Siculibacillus sp.]|nr:hypothetical protein [Siculibacillus sp.]
MIIGKAARAIVDYVSNLLTAPNELKRLRRDFDHFTATWGSTTGEPPLLADEPGAVVCRLVADTPHPIFNPSLVATGEGTFLGTVRSSNFVKFAETTHVREAEVYDVRSHLFRLTADLDCEFIGELDDGAVRHPGSPAENGIEDCRLFRHRGDIWGVGSAVRQRGRGLPVHPILFRLDGTKIVEHHFGWRTQGFIEKNWTPVEGRETPTLLRLLSPPDVIELRDGELVRLSDARPSKEPLLLRGGTPSIPFGRHHLAVAHLAPRKIWGRLHYPHCFVVHDERLRHVETSEPFYFRRPGLEFACGLQIHGGDLFVSYGVADRAAEVMRLPLAALEKRLVAARY